MNAATIADVWSRGEVLDYQAGRIAELRTFAASQSPFYRESIPRTALGNAPLVRRAQYAALAH